MTYKQRLMIKHLVCNIFIFLNISQYLFRKTKNKWDNKNYNKLSHKKFVEH